MARIKGLEELFDDYMIAPTPAEAMLLDYILSLEHYEEHALEWLMRPERKELRIQAGSIIIGQKKTLRLNQEDLEWLLLLIPITFRFVEEDVGYSLKVKLYKAYLGVKENASQDGTADNPSGEAEGGSITTADPF